VLNEHREPGVVTLDHADGRRRAWLHAAGVVEREEPDDSGTRLTVRWTRRQREAFEALDGDQPRPDDPDLDDEEEPRRLGGWDPLAND